MIKSRTFLVSFLSMLVASIFIQKIHSISNVEIIEKNLDKLPHEIGNFMSIDIKMDDAVVKELNTDVYVFREYVDDKGEKITLYIGYYGTKKGGRTGHNPSACYPGSGWSILNKSAVKVSAILDGKKRIITLNSLHVRKNGNNFKLAYHWYQSNGDEVLSSGIEQNLHRFKSKILYNRNDGAFISVSSPIIQSISNAENRMKLFVKEIFPLIVEHWPKER